MQNNSPHPKLPRAKKLDIWLSQKREMRARKRGKQPTVIPYVGYGTSEWVRVLGRVALLRSDGNGAPHIDVKYQDGRVRGWRSFLIVHAPHEVIKVYIDNKYIGDITADSGGVLDSHIQTKLRPGWHRITFVSAAGIRSASRVFITKPGIKFGVVCDIDDTILNTMLPKPLVAAWNSFVLNEHARLSVPGMPVLLDELQHQNPGAPFIYLSTGAWNVAPALGRFLKRNLYPIGAMLLTDWGPTTERFFRSGADHKRTELRRLALEFPDVKWLLIGDDGQHDEMLYKEFVSAHPENVCAVAIRQLTPGQAVLAGGRSGAEIHSEVAQVPWVYGPDGAALRKALRRIGILKK